ncbi:MAG: hypothetical protein AB1665_00390 [Candidatus Thermoplasmatota archaeon]
MKRDTGFILAGQVGKLTQDIYDKFIAQTMDNMELPTPDNPVTFYSDGDDGYKTSLKKMYAPTCYKFGQLIKVKKNGRLKKVDRHWVVGEGDIKQINTTQVENIHGIARGSQSHLVRKTKGFAKKSGRVVKFDELFKVYRNFIKTDKNGRTPAMKEEVWTVPITWETFFRTHYQT